MAVLSADGKAAPLAPDGRVVFTPSDAPSDLSFNPLALALVVEDESGHRLRSLLQSNPEFALIGESQLRRNGTWLEVPRLHALDPS